jgi:hypothetical protein
MFCVPIVHLLPRYRPLGRRRRAREPPAPYESVDGPLIQNGEARESDRPRLLSRRRPGQPALRSRLALAASSATEAFNLDISASISALTCPAFASPTVFSNSRFLSIS